MKIASGYASELIVVGIACRHAWQASFVLSTYFVIACTCTFVRVLHVCTVFCLGSLACVQWLGVVPKCCPFRPRFSTLVVPTPCFACFCVAFFLFVLSVCLVMLFSIPLSKLHVCL